MPSFLRWTCVFACLALSPLFAQMAPLPSPSAQSTPAPAQAQPAAPAAQQSLADMARKMRKDHPAEVKMTDAQTKELFDSVDKVFEFASNDTGFQRRTAIKRKLVSPADIEQFTKDRLAKAEYSQRFARAELTMKKFGLLPRDFNLRDFLVKANGKQVAGLYDEDSKTISLLNTVSFEQQGPILAHELTHALQDQNFDLKTWARAGAKSQDSNDDSSSARHAIVEGQAMVVYLDYMLAPYGRSLENTPGIVAEMGDPAVQATIDTEMLHNAPMVLREAGAFPYRDGLIFEGEVLQKAGKQAAFAGVFARPPRNSHEVLDPRAYLEREKYVPVVIPDVRSLLTNQYEVYDAGSFGELDVRALLRQFGDRRSAADLAPNWQGGTYIAFKRAQASNPQPTTADLALLYVSHWKTPQAAEKFARFYATTVSRRYSTAAVQPVPACAGTACPAGAALISTDEGPVIVEEWSDNTVIVSESFDPAVAARLSTAVRSATPDQHALLSLPANKAGRAVSLPAHHAEGANEAEVANGAANEAKRTEKIGLVNAAEGANEAEAANGVANEAKRTQAIGLANAADGANEAEVANGVANEANRTEEIGLANPADAANEAEVANGIAYEAKRPEEIGLVNAAEGANEVEVANGVANEANRTEEIGLANPADAAVEEPAFRPASRQEKTGALAPAGMNSSPVGRGAPGFALSETWDSSHDELSLRLFLLPAFRTWQLRLEQRVTDQLIGQYHKAHQRSSK